ncbi:Putative membrane protein (fragment) [Carnobacterium maltaromaticum]
MSMKKYVFKKIVTDFVIINIIINGIFYIFNFRKFSGQLTFNDIATDLFVGLLLLGGACSLIGFVNMRKELLKGK